MTNEAQQPINLGAGTVVEGFGTTEIATQHETAATAVAKQLEAAVQARYVMALKRPRDYMVVRDRLLNECKRSGFADSAVYSKPVGGGNSIKGLSIRFAEAALRCLTNCMPETVIKYDDPEKRLMCVMLTDLENNITFQKDIIVEKTVERRKLKTGQKALGQRTNSYGDTVYLVRATEDDMLNKVNSQESKALRNHILRLIPGDIVDDCTDQLKKTQQDRDKQDPQGAQKKLLDAFSGLGVKPGQIVKFLGRNLDGKIQPAELNELREMYQAIKQGEAKWADFVAAKEEAGADANKPKPKTRRRPPKTKPKDAEAPDGKADDPPQGEPADQSGPSPNAPTARARDDEADNLEAARNVLIGSVKTSGQIISMQGGEAGVKDMFTAASLRDLEDINKWAMDEIKYALAMLNDLGEQGRVPLAPEPPPWLGKGKTTDAWKKNYAEALKGFGLT